VISQATFEGLADPAAFPGRELDRVQVKGKQEAVVLHEVFPALSPVLRLDGRMPLMEALATLGQQCSERGREALWPFVADEYLSRKPGTSSASEARALKFLDELQPHAVSRAVERLCVLPALAQRKLARDFFAVSQPRGYRLMAYLLATPRADLIGPDVFARLRPHPITLPGAAEVLHALERYRPEYATFLHHLLLGMVSGRASQDLVSEGCTLLVRAMRRLDTERRKEHWVSEAIAHLGEMRWVGAKALLESIVGQRKWGLAYAWPSECRKSAQQALRSLAGQEADG